MKTDIDALMQEANVDALFVTGSGRHNPTMHYLTAGADVTSADLIKKRGEPGVLFHSPIERDGAKRTGLPTRSYSSLPHTEIMKEAKGDVIQFFILRYMRMFEDLEIRSGRVALYGQIDMSKGYAILSGLQKRLPNIEFVGFQNNDVLNSARNTKDKNEIARIQEMGRISTEVVGEVADFISGHEAKSEILVGKGGDPLTIGDIKRRITLWLAERGAEDTGTIFAIGRDAGVPHNRGNPEDFIHLGKTIIFDISPCEAGGGYYFDLTRTWCVGYAPDAVQELYEQVNIVYHTIVKELKIGSLFADYTRRACELFEEYGHETICSHPRTEVGFNHSLGHGVGLDIHEFPFSQLASQDMIMPGSVITIEPGLYYPDRGMGVRIEDTLWAAPDGEFEIVADYPKELVLPIKSK
ncbi:MAG: Xaa-Pro peptidase family protein [Anaerolineaceae bacterium]|nr:Xaa-Pro peptidase family protein [Anaerolineaceae bacterium]